MKKITSVFFTLIISCSALFAQVAVNSDGTQPDASAMMDVKSTNKGALFPRMSQAQISFIVNPANGLVVFCTTDNKFYVYVASANAWKEILYGAGALGYFTCGSAFTISHVAGMVAPVPKTVTYATVTNIPGEPSKCWITSNLGADHQATAKNDATEASAGWYWQFNRMQGYKLADDGITRTPNTPWITTYSGNSDWIPANDPCALELGNGWRLPTYAEWYNVDNIGNWTNWNGPWNSGLKMHAAGCLQFVAGQLDGRGSYGFYWSSTQYAFTDGWDLYFSSGQGFMHIDDKLSGITLRCIRD